MMTRSLDYLRRQYPTYDDLRRRDRRDRRRNRIVSATFYATVFVWSVWCGIVIEVARHV